ALDRIPLQGRAGAHGPADAHARGGGRPPCQRGEHRRVEAGHTGGEVEVDTLDHVSVLPPLLDANVLMLPVVVLVRLHDPYARKTRIVERPVVPAAPEAVEPV